MAEKITTENAARKTKRKKFLAFQSGGGMIDLLPLSRRISASTISQ
jgi:hypothetical protein